MKRLQDVGHAVLEIEFLKAVRVEGGHVWYQGDDCFPNDDLFAVSVFQCGITDRLEEVGHCLMSVTSSFSDVRDVYSEASRRKPTWIPRSHR